MEQQIAIPARVWTEVYSLANFPKDIAFRIYNDADQVVRVATQVIKPTTRDAGIPTYVKKFTHIPVNLCVWVLSAKATTLILQWDSDRTIIPEVNVTGVELKFLSGKIDDLISVQRGMLSLLEAAFEDGISGRTIEDGDC